MFFSFASRNLIIAHARYLFQVHKDYYFGETMLNTIHLCFRGAKAADGYYEITSKVDLVD